MKKVRTRYAPSPTGYLHIGGARSALFGYLYAKHNNGTFIVRTEDTDYARNVEGGEASQLDNLEWLGIVPDESPLKPVAKYGKYRQSEKLDRYQEVLETLVKNNKAYKAYDSSEELTAQREEQLKAGKYSFRYDKNWLKISDEEKKNRDEKKEYSYRLALEEDKDYAWEDIVRGNISVNTKDIGDFVIMKSDGYPTYNFAVVVDDHDMEMTHVFRGEEHITNTPKQLAIYDALGWEVPEFGHLTIITNMEGKKLSKRDNSVKQFISDYKDEGYHAHAIFNFLALLGWTHADAKEVLSHDELVKDFLAERLSKSPSKFDVDKMNWFSKEYIKNQDNKEIEKMLDLGSKDAEWKDMFIDTYKQNAHTYKMIQDSLKIYEDETVKKQELPEVVVAFAKALNEKEFSIDSIKASIDEAKDATGAKGKNLFMPIRMFTTYQEHGPELAKAIYLFGEKLIKERLGL